MTHSKILADSGNEGKLLLAKEEAPKIHEVIHLPDEIIMDILTRLPVRYLQRFKCVSSYWNTLISDRYLIMSHLNRAKNDPYSQKILATSLPPLNDKLEFYRFSLSSSPVQVIEDEQRLDWPPNCKPHCVLRCCCDGLILLTTSDIKIKLTYLLLWNPSTRESIPLPAREYELGDWHLHNWVFGMGYDATSDDYKILAAKLNAPSNEKVSVEILSLKSFSWRKISKYPAGMGPVSGFLHCGMDSLTFIHGAFHWLARSSKRYTIISFNISNEVYGEIPLLEGMYDMQMPRLNHGVSMLRGMLCYYNTPIGFALPWPSTYKFWVMKDYGIKESWIQWLEIPHIDGLGSAIPCYVFADDDVLLELIMFRGIEPLYWTSKRGTFQLWPKLFQTIVYTELDLSKVTYLIFARVC